MRKTTKIAANELRAFFYSPVAWLLLLIFMFQASSTFIDDLHGILRQQALGAPVDYSLTGSLLTGIFGLFTLIQQNLYLYIPLLTMGLLSREKSNGSMPLLYSSPVSARQIIIGKYLAVMIYGALMIAALATIILFYALVIPRFDLPLALSGLLGLYLLIGAYAAIGLYMSSLTSYQIVAAMGTLALLTCLNFIGGIGQGIDLVRDITHWLSIKGRATVFIDGLISSEETCYFLIVILLFLTLSTMKLEAHRARKNTLATARRHAIVIIAAIALGYATSRPTLLLYHDTTARKTQTLAPESQRVLDAMQGKLTITAHVNILGANYSRGLPNAVNGNIALFKPYLRFKPDITMDYRYYYHKPPGYDNPRFAGMSDKEIAERHLKNAATRVKPLLPLQETTHPDLLEAEGYRFFWHLTGENGRASSLRLFNDMIFMPTENEISAAIKRLVHPPTRVAFVTGHGERDPAGIGDRDYYSFARSLTFRHALVNQGFEPLTCRLDNDTELPDDHDVMVIAASRAPFTPREIEHVTAFVERGGNLLILGEPDTRETLNPLLAPLGARLLEGTLVQPSDDYSPDLLTCTVTEAGATLLPGLERTRRKEHLITLPGAAGISWENTRDFRVEPLLVTPDSGSWCHTAPLDLTLLDTLTPPPGAERAYPTAIALVRPVQNREQRVMIIGDADCFSNAELLMTREGIPSDNFTLLVETFRWLSNGEFPVNTRRPDPEDTTITLTLSSMKWVRLLFSWTFPTCMIICFIIIRLRRQRH